MVRVLGTTQPDCGRHVKQTVSRGRAIQRRPQLRIALIATDRVTNRGENRFNENKQQVY